MTVSERRWRFALLAGAGVCWLASMFMPALAAAGTTLDGFDVLRRGWQGAQAAVLAWYANPVFVAAGAAGWLGRARLALALAVTALALAVSSLATRQIASLAGRNVPEIQFGGGFFLWLAAFGLLLAWALMLVRSPKD